MKAKKRRNQRLIDFAEKHPDYTQYAIGRVFHIDRSRVSRILKKAKEVKGGKESKVSGECEPDEYREEVI